MEWSERKWSSGKRSGKNIKAIRGRRLVWRGMRAVRRVRKKERKSERIWEREEI